MSDNDDVQVGRLLSRREVLALFGVAGAVLIVGCSDDGGGGASPTSAATRGSAATAQATSAATSSATTAVPSCVVRPELTEGPYFVDEKLERSDIRSDPSDGSAVEGTQLDIIINVSQVGSGSCSPLAGATVDVWHCDAQGVYSDVQDAGFDTTGQKFLRGYQVTDANGQVRFTTVYPGWYQGRATHIHFKIRTGDGYEFTSQFFFDDALSDEVHAVAPYLKSGTRLQNSDDNIYSGGGDQLLLDVQTSGAGYGTTFDIGLQV